MARVKKGDKQANSTGATIGYKAQLWRMADALRDELLSKLISGTLSVYALATEVIA